MTKSKSTKEDAKKGNAPSVGTQKSKLVTKKVSSIISKKSPKSKVELIATKKVKNKSKQSVSKINAPAKKETQIKNVPVDKVNHKQTHLTKESAQKIAEPINAKSYSLKHLFQQAIDVHQQGNMLEAQKLCRKMIEINPNSFDAYHFLGIMAVQERQLELASKMLVIALEKNPHVPQAHNNLGVIWRSLGQPERALQSVIKAIELNPKYAEAFNNQGVLYCDLGKVELAINSFKKALEIRPEYQDAKNNHDVLSKNN